MRTSIIKSIDASSLSSPGRALTHAAFFVTFAALAGCSGGGTTGHEKLDGNAPTITLDVATESGGEKIDAWADSVGSDADGGSADARSDVSQTPDVEDATSEPPADISRVRDGVVVRDGIILDPSDATDGPETSADAPPPTVCGDGKKEGKEECDDGNKKSGDNCSSLCKNTAACDACIVESLKDPNFMHLKDAWPVCEYLTGNAKGGEGAGRPLKDLCQEVYTCILRTECMDWKSASVSSCYCGTAIEVACLTMGKPNGPCRFEIENGVESIDPTIVANGLGSLSTATGAAVQMLQFQATDWSPEGLPECRSVCMPGAMPPDGGTVDSGTSFDTGTSSDTGGASESGVSDAPNAQ